MPETNRCEGAFNGIGGPQVSPVFRGEVIEGEQCVTILLEAFASLGVLRSILLQEFVESLIRVVLGRCLPYFMQIAFRF